MNRPSPTEMPNITATTLLNVNPPSKAEIELTLRQLRNGKTAGSDGIPPEALKIDPKTITAM